MHCKRRSGLLLPTYVLPYSIPSKVSVSLGARDQGCRKTVCIAVQYSRSGLLHHDPFIVSQLSCGPLSYFGLMETNLVNRHTKRSCTQSSRFRIRRGELNSHAFSLVNRLQHQILRAICSNRRRFPLAQSSNPHAQVGPHGTGSSAVSVLMPARVSVLNPFTMTRATVAMTVNVKMMVFRNASGYAPRRAKLSRLWLSSGRSSRLEIDYGDDDGGCISDRQWFSMPSHLFLSSGHDYDGIS